MTTDPNEKPVALPVVAENIPTELTGRDQWVLWRYELRDGKWTKPPFQRNGRQAKSTDAKTWCAFANALAAYRAGGFDGIGYVPTPDEGLTAADADHCRDPFTGTVKGDDAAALLELDTYTEVSPSGTGLRAFAWGRKPDTKSKKGGFELYDVRTAEGKPGGRFLTVTGHHLDIAPANIEPRQAQIEEVYFRYWPKPELKAAGCAGASGNASGLTEFDLLQKMFEAKNGPKIRSLWDGDTSAHRGDESAADLALCLHLAFWFGNDAGRIERAFNGSKLAERGKWANRKDYRDRTIARAIERTAEVYTPTAPKPVAIRSAPAVREDGTRPTDPAGCSAEPAGGRETPKPKFEFIDGPDFLAADYRQEFLIPRVLVANQPGVIAGPSKAMKTSITVDMAVSLAAGAPFLGEFPVPRPVRVAVVSGESGEATLQETVRRVLAARSIDGAALGDRLKMCFNLPMFPDLANMAEFADALLALGVKVVVIDPVYLCLGGDIDHANMFQMGAAFGVVTNVLLRAGVTPILVHHANRQLRTGEPMEITHLAYAGLEQYTRQFVMINRQSAYRGDGVHDLWLSAGGSAGHGGLWSVRIEEGVVDAQFRGRSWGVTVQNPGEAQADRIGQKELKRREAERQKMREAEGMVFDAIDQHSGAPTMRQLRERTGFRATKVEEVVRGLVEEGVVEEFKEVISVGRGAKREAKKYRRASKGIIGNTGNASSVTSLVTDAH